MKIHLSDIKWKYLSKKGKDWLDLMGKSLDVEPIKVATHHSVYRHAAGIYIKIFHYPFFRSLFRSPKRAKACKEGLVLLRLQEIGFDCPEVMAFGENRRFNCLRQDVLITMELTGLLPIPKFTNKTTPGLSFKTKRQAIATFASMINKLHQSGVYHRDLNFGNIFIRSNQGAIHFAILDVDKVRFYSKQVPKKICIRNLGDFLQMFWLLTTVSERFFFLKRYGFDEFQFSKKKWASRIEKRALNTINKISTARYRKCLSNRGGFIRKETKDYTIHFSRSPESSKLIDISYNPELFLKDADLNVAPKSSSESIVSYKNGSYILKQYEKGASKIWATIFGGFITRRIPIRRPLVYFESRHGSGLCSSYILYENIEQGETLSCLWPKLNSHEKSHLLVKISFLTGYIHKSGCYHGMLSWDNILIRPNPFQNQIFFRNFEKSRILRWKGYQTVKSDLVPFMADLRAFDNNKKNHDMFLKSWHKWSGFNAQ